MLDVANLELAAGFAEIDLLARRARRGEHRDLVRRKLALGEDVEHLAPDIAGRAGAHPPITHVSIHSLLVVRAGRARSSEERRVWNECVRPGRPQWCPVLVKKKKNQ